MNQVFRAFPIIAVLALAGCATGSVSTASLGPTLPGPGQQQQMATIGQPMQVAPSQTVATAQAMTDVGPFIDAGIVGRLSARDRTEASTAQFNALQFGRAGAPRNWNGDAGTSGSVLVGPPVNVNSLYCRDFTHTVTVGGQSYARKGMACREADGRWNVAQG